MRKTTLLCQTIVAAMLAIFFDQSAHAQVAPKIDVAFALDATGSMGGEIANARKHIKQIVNELRSGDPAPEVRFGLVLFRDVGDEYVTQVHGFTTNNKTMQRSLDGAKARGGGDTPEAVLEGVSDAIKKLKWTPVSTDAMRVLYVVGDAAAKHYPTSPSESALAKLALKKKIVIHSILCGVPSSSRSTYEELARYTEGRYYDIRNRNGGSLSDTVTATTRTYSAAVGVDFDSKTKISLPHDSFETPAVSKSGLIGRSVRWVTDPETWNDIWAAHVSLMPPADRPPVPPIDFATQHLVVAGGSRGGLLVQAVESDGEHRWARVAPTDDLSVSFTQVPVDSKGDAK